MAGLVWSKTPDVTYTTRRTVYGCGVNGSSTYPEGTHFTLQRHKTHRRFACFDHGMNHARMTKITVASTPYYMAACHTVPKGPQPFGGWYMGTITLVKCARSV